MIITRCSRTVRHLTRLLINAKGTEKQESDESGGSIIKGEDTRLMEDTLGGVKISGLEDRQVTGANSFQRQILEQNKFDLMHPRISPKVASLSTSIGIDKSGKDGYLAQISLGQVRVKKEDEVFLSQVDPYNIPEYHNIIMDYQKQMTLVGRPIQTKGESEAEDKSSMGISTHRSFEEKSQQELAGDVLGVKLRMILNSRRVWKELLVALVLVYFIFGPILEAAADLNRCQVSIKQIEEERMNYIAKVKRQATVKALIENPQMRL